MPLAIKQNKRIKFKGVWEHYDSRHFIRPPPHLGEALSSMIQESKNLKVKKDEEVEEEEDGERCRDYRDRRKRGRGKLTFY